MGRKKGTCGELSRSTQIFLRPDERSSFAGWELARLAVLDIFSAFAVSAGAIDDGLGNLRSPFSSHSRNTLSNGLLEGRSGL